MLMKPGQKSSAVTLCSEQHALLWEAINITLNLRKIELRVEKEPGGDGTGVVFLHFRAAYLKYMLGAKNKIYGFCNKPIKL